MAFESLQAVIGTAIVDSRFRSSLLSKQIDALEDFDLSREECVAIEQSKATTIQGFAQDMQSWIARRLTSTAGSLS
ncbi:MAG: hypothetical protein GX557_14140 [Chloroflexi bacterium]|nr:hypothetical protein [Chloroflexota bacterium]